MELNKILSQLIGTYEFVSEFKSLGEWDEDNEVLAVAGYKFTEDGEGYLESVTDPEGNRLEAVETDEDIYELMSEAYDVLSEMVRFSEAEIEDWFRQMQYTVKTGDDGTQYAFLAILCGKGKVNPAQMTQIAEVAYKNVCPNGRFCMDMWIGGKVDWTMFYDQPFSHVNGHETYFCHGVAKDNYSPDDWEADMATLRTALGRKVTQKDYIDFLFNGRKVKVVA